MYKKLFFLSLATKMKHEISWIPFTIAWKQKTYGKLKKKIMCASGVRWQIRSFHHVICEWEELGSKDSIYSEERREEEHKESSKKWQNS